MSLHAPCDENVVWHNLKCIIISLLFLILCTCSTSFTPMIGLQCSCNIATAVFDCFLRCSPYERKDKVGGIWKAQKVPERVRRCIGRTQDSQLFNLFHVLYNRFNFSSERSISKDLCCHHLGTFLKTPFNCELSSKKPFRWIIYINWRFWLVFDRELQKNRLNIMNLFNWMKPPKCWPCSKN